MSNQTFDPYCGPAPVPDDVWSSWNADPWLLVALAAALGLCMLTSSRAHFERRRLSFSGLALAVLFIAFVSPLCALSSALFSARVFHHVLLVAAAAPLLALAFPARDGIQRLPLSALFLAHAVAMWFWHAPGPYAFALSSHAAYWFMEFTLFATAFLMWQAVLARWTHSGAALAVLLGSIVQMGMLGALLTFAARPLFEPHLTTTLDFGLTPLADQQLAGLLMWVPAALPYLAAALLIGGGLLRKADESRRGGDVG
jgi:putative membrane protein